MLGQIVDGKYEILRLVGEGGMGAVYEARQKTTGRRTAVKLISNDDVVRNEMLIARFEREAQAAAAVRSPHIVEISDAGHDAATGQPYMVMELLVGMNVHRLLKELGPLPPELAVRIAIQTCFGLEKAHAAGVVHRDIKPANLFMSESDGDERVVKLLDFGVAKFKMDQASEGGQDGLTRTGSVLGSPMFMSPEQARGLKTIDHRADIWSLGVVLYQLLSGKTPHSGIEGVGELIITICSEAPTPLSKRAPWISPKLERVVHGALQLAAGDRYQSATAMREALASCLVEPTQWHIRNSMLVRLSDTERDARPPEGAAAMEEDGATLAIDSGAAPNAPSAQPSANDGATMALEPEQVGGAGSLPFASAPVPATAPREPQQGFGRHSAHVLESGPSRRPVEPQPSKAAGVTKALVAVAVGVVLGVGTVGFFVTRSERAHTAQDAAAHPTTAAPAQTAASVDPVAATATAAPTESAAAAAATNKVKIVPSLAGVTVDGKRVEKDADGNVAIDGAINSSHTVIVTWRGAPIIKQVVLTDKGPAPREIVVPIDGGTTPATGGASPAAPTAPPPPVAPPSPLKKIEF